MIVSHSPERPGVSYVLLQRNSARAHFRSEGRQPEGSAKLRSPVLACLTPTAQSSRLRLKNSYGPLDQAKEMTRLLAPHTQSSRIYEANSAEAKHTRMADYLPESNAEECEASTHKGRESR